MADSQHLFTSEDHMFPVYCLLCRNHTPRADMIASVCGGCIEEDRQRKAAAMEPPPAPTIPIPTAGSCLRCGSANVAQETETRETDNAWIVVAKRAFRWWLVAFAIGFIIGFFGGVSSAAVVLPVEMIFEPPLLLIAVVSWLIGCFVPPKRTVTSNGSRCSDCGCQWKG